MDSLSFFFSSQRQEQWRLTHAIEAFVPVCKMPLTRETVVCEAEIDSFETASKVAKQTGALLCSVFNDASPFADIQYHQVPALAARSDLIVCQSFFTRSQLLRILPESDWHKVIVLRAAFGVEPEPLGKQPVYLSHDAVTVLTPRVQQAALFSEANFLVVPQMRENMLPLIGQALAMGRGVIASRSVTARELVVPNVTGLAVLEGDQEALEAAVQTLSSDAKRVRGLSKAALAFAQDELSPEKEADRFFSALIRISNGQMITHPRSELA